MFVNCIPGVSWLSWRDAVIRSWWRTCALTAARIYVCKWKCLTLQYGFYFFVAVNFWQNRVQFLVLKSVALLTIWLDYSLNKSFIFREKEQSTDKCATVSMVPNIPELRISEQASIYHGFIAFSISCFDFFLSWMNWLN